MEDYNNSSYNDNTRLVRPVRTPEAESNGMAKASRICGIISIISIITMLVYPSVILGAMAIILALLSRGKSSRLSERARKGLTTGIIAMIVNLALVGCVVAVLFSKGEYKDQINNVCKDIYGQTFDDMLDDAMDGSLDLEYHNLPGQIGGGF